MIQYDICVISAPSDEEIAHRLADSIRSYHLPRGVVLPDPALDYRRIVVDSTGSHLDVASIDLLDHSRYLIVICSPEAKQSQGINARLTYFRNIRRDDDVVAVIASGEPVDSFPENFIERKIVRHIMPDMRIIEREETIEPVASDLRAPTAARRRQLLRYETVRIIASVLGLHPDALEQRHRRRRQQAISAAAGIVGAVVLIASGIFLRLGYIASREADIARQQTELSQAAAHRMVDELPALFEGDTQAQTYIQQAITQAQDALEQVDASDDQEASHG